MKETNAAVHSTTRWYQTTWFRYMRDGLIAMAIISAVMIWQSKDMLDVDGTAHIPQQNLVSLQGEIAPMLATDTDNLVYFFAPWCAICDLSITNLNYLNPEKVNVVVIALDYQNQQEVQQFIDNNPIDSPVFLGNDGLKERFQIQGYPSYYLIDKNGTVLSRSYGYSTAVGLKLREVFGT